MSDTLIRGGAQQAELTWPVLIERGLVPPDPATEVGAARIPPPPTMDYYSDPVAALTYLWATRCLSSAMRRRRPKFREETQQSLQCAVAAFDATGIPPGAWVAWTADDWKHRIGNTGALPLNYVFGPARLCDPDVLALYVRDAGGYRGGALLPFGPSHRELLWRYKRLRRTVLSGPITSERVVTLNQLCFPPGMYRTLVVRAVAEVEQAKRELADDVRAGVCVW